MESPKEIPKTAVCSKLQSCSAHNRITEIYELPRFDKVSLCIERLRELQSWYLKNLSVLVDIKNLVSKVHFRRRDAKLLL